MKTSIETYSPKTLSAAIGIPRRTILAAIKSGKLECAKANSRFFVIHSKAAAKWFNSLSNRHNSTQLPTKPDC